MISDITEEIAETISADEVLIADGNVTVVVEDKAVVEFEIQQALGQCGVCVLVAATGFRVKDSSPVLQGVLSIQITCYENPELNRGDASSLTATAVAERIATILHYGKPERTVGQIVFKDMSRDDVKEANILRSNYEVQAVIGT